MSTDGAFLLSGTSATRWAGLWPGRWSRGLPVKELLMLCRQTGAWKGCGDGASPRSGGRGDLIPYARTRHQVRGEVERAAGLELQVWCSRWRGELHREAPSRGGREGLLAERGHFEHPVPGPGVGVAGEGGARSHDRPQDEQVRGDMAHECAGAVGTAERPALPVVQ